MALADANYKFLYADVGAEGGTCDTGKEHRTVSHQTSLNIRDFGTT